MESHLKIDYSMQDYYVGRSMIDEGEMCLTGDIVEKELVISICALYSIAEIVALFCSS